VVYVYKMYYSNTYYAKDIYICRMAGLTPETFNRDLQSRIHFFDEDTDCIFHCNCEFGFVVGFEFKHVEYLDI